jgi:hypothetical protein
MVLVACADVQPVDPRADAGCVPCKMGGRQCGPSGEVQICSDFDGDGCAEWGGEAACPEGGACVEGACVATCSHACAQGEAVCGAGGQRVCGDADGDGCRELGPAMPCPEGDRCDNGACVDEARICEPACGAADQRECVDETGYRRCGQFDEDVCLDWSVTIPCSPGTACMGGGECVPTCVDDCEAGVTRCDGDGRATCANFDADPCLEFGPIVPCGAEERCDDGACVPAAEPCEDACEGDGMTVCEPEGNGYRRCGQYDADACRELSELVPCAAFEACEAGGCVPNCENDCEIGGRRCGAGGPEICGNFDPDPCLEFGPPSPCGADERCDDGLCVDVVVPCEDACEAGVLRCAEGGVQICADQDDDPCLEWSAAVPCGADERCEGAGQCVSACEDACQAGDLRCAGEGLARCADYDADPCLEFGPAEACPQGQSCSEGACRVDCVHDCADGATDCVAEGARRCGQFDADACRDWSSPTPCGPREACEAGACVAVCEDECADADRRCLGEGFELCGDFDADPCLEYGGGAACEAGASCLGGECQVDCMDDCADGATRCADPTHQQTCGNFDADPCLEWGVDEACDNNETCAGAACALAEAPVLVINEVLYDVDGADPSGVFTELHGAPGTALAGLHLVGVNGSNNQTYNTIELVGVLPADGLWVVAHTQANAALQGVADQLSAAADYQNGADTIQLRWGDTVVDAVAYGTFGAGDHPAGEGQPVAEPAVDWSLSRDANHTDTNDNAADFSEQVPSPGVAAACADICAADALRCAADVAERCTRGADGCLDWAAIEDCGAAGDPCVGGVCQAQMGCAVPDAVGAWRDVGALAANLGTMDALPRVDGGWAITAGYMNGPQMQFALLDADAAVTVGPHTLGNTNHPPWGGSASSVYYPSMVEGEGQYAVTWSAFSDQGNRDIYFRRVSLAGAPIARQNLVISGPRKGFSPQVRAVPGGFKVIYNAYRQLLGIPVTDLGVEGARFNVGPAHGDTREQTFLGWAHQTDGSGAVAYAVNTEDFRNPRLFVQPLTSEGTTDGARADLGVPEITARYPNVHLFNLSPDRYGLFWRGRLADANNTHVLNYAVINRAGVIELRVELNELDRPALYKPNVYPESIAFDGQRFGIYQHREFEGEEPSHHMVQWMTPEGVHIDRVEVPEGGAGILRYHPDAAQWWVFGAGNPVRAATLGCQ